ncbi:hypothetical protein ILYODFUR_010377, partial [Ilyodon furcidens]
MRRQELGSSMMRQRTEELRGPPSETLFPLSSPLSTHATLNLACMVILLQEETSLLEHRGLEKAEKDRVKVERMLFQNCKGVRFGKTEDPRMPTARHLN